MSFFNRNSSARPSADAVARAQGFGMVVPDAPSSPAASPDRATAILSSPEAVGREAQAAHLAKGTTLPAAEAIGILAAGPRNSTLSAAFGGAVAAREALGLPPDPVRDAQLARGIESVLGTSGYSAPAAASEAEEYAAGQAAARKLLGR